MISRIEVSIEPVLHFGSIVWRVIAYGVDEDGQKLRFHQPGALYQSLCLARLAQQRQVIMMQQALKDMTHHDG